MRLTPLARRRRRTIAAARLQNLRDDIAAIGSSSDDPAESCDAWEALELLGEVRRLLGLPVWERRRPAVEDDGD